MAASARGLNFSPCDAVQGVTLYCAPRTLAGPLRTSTDSHSVVVPKIQFGLGGLGLKTMTQVHREDLLGVTGLEGAILVPPNLQEFQVCRGYIIS